MEVSLFGKKLRWENIFFDALQLRFRQEFIPAKSNCNFDKRPSAIYLNDNL